MKKFSAFLALLLVAVMFTVLIPAQDVEAAHPTFEKWKKVGQQKQEETVAPASQVQPCSYYYYYPTFISIPNGRSNLISFDGGLHYFEVVDGQIVNSPYYNAYPFGYYPYYYNWYYYNWYYYPYFYVPFGYYSPSCCGR